MNRDGLRDRAKRLVGMFHEELDRRSSGAEAIPNLSAAQFRTISVVLGIYRAALEGSNDQPSAPARRRVRPGIIVEIGFVGTQFTEGKKTRWALVVGRPAAFCTVTGLT